MRACRDADALRAQLAAAEATHRAASATLLQREAELETAQFSLAEVDTLMTAMREENAAMAAAAAAADERAAAATGSLDGIKEEAEKAIQQADKHREVRARAAALG